MKDHIGRRPTLLTLAVLIALFGSCFAATVPAEAAAGRRYDLIRGVRFATPEKVELECDVYRPRADGPHPGVLVIHGGAWAIGTRQQLFHICRHLAANGFVAVTVDYRLAPAYKFPAQLDDVRAGLDWMIEHAEQYKIDPERLAAWGYSAGGHLATLLGSQDARLRAVVAGGAPCDLRALAGKERKLAYFLGGTAEEVPQVYDAASPVTHASADDPPMFFYHGELDLLVPPAQPKAMIAALKKAAVAARLFLVPKAGHQAALISPSAIREGRKFLAEKLLRQPPGETNVE